MLKFLLAFFMFTGLYFVLGATVSQLSGKADGRELAAPQTVLPENSLYPGPDRVTLVENPQLAMQSRIAMLREARQSLDIAYYTTAAGPSSAAFYVELFNAAERGVKVRVLLDGKLGPSGSENKAVMFRLMAHPNIEFKLYNPMHVLRPTDWNCMLHDKIILMDGMVLLTGGRNIGDRFFIPEGFSEEAVYDRDVLVNRVSGQGESVLPEVAAYFELLWNAPHSICPTGRAMTDRNWRELQDNVAAFAARNPAFYQLSLADILEKSVPTSSVGFVYNPVHLERKEPAVASYLYQLGQNAERIVIQTPYATANEALLAGLSRLAGQAEVIYLTNSPGSSPNLPAFSNYLSQRGKFLDTGISIYEYQGEGSIHAKSMIFDNHISAVGTLNLDDRSMYINTESMLIIDSPEFAAQLQQAVDDLLNQSLQVGPDNRYVPRAGLEARPVGSGKRVLLDVVSVFSRAFQFLI